MIAVGFDFDHTLGVDNRLERTVALETLAALARERGASYDGAAAERAIDATLEDYRAGRLPVETAIAGFFAELLGPNERNEDAAGTFRDAVVARAPEFVRPVAGAREMLAALDALGVPYALLTNGWSPLQEEKARLIGFAAPVFVSERIGARKPAREAFAVLSNHFALPFDRLWYVGDDPYPDCGGSLALGMTAVWFDWEAKTYPAGLAAPTFVVHALAELPALVQGRAEAAAKRPE